MAARGIQNGKYQGSKWIRRERRLAIYLRDGLACVYCGANIEEHGITLTLDHLTPYSKGGSSTSHNLVTACQKCNSSRGDRSVEEFSKVVAAYLNHDIAAEGIMKGIAKNLAQPLDIIGAKRIIERRGDWQSALRRPY